MLLLPKSALAVLSVLVGAGLLAVTADAQVEEAGEVVSPVVTQPEADPESVEQAFDRKLEFAVFQKHCTSCHNSVADPERPGKTRDEWYRVVALMQGHGLIITQQEADMIVDLLYTLRRGIEERPG